MIVGRGDCGPAVNREVLKPRAANPGEANANTGNAGSFMQPSD